MSFKNIVVLVWLLAVATAAGAQSQSPATAEPPPHAVGQDASDGSQPPADANTRPVSAVPVAPAVPSRTAQPAPARRPARSSTRISADTGVAFPADI